MDGNDFEVRLSHLRHGVQTGAIRLTDLAVLADALQDLNTRIARLVIGQDGPGRTQDAAAQVAQLRLTGIRGGSTRLEVSYGEQPTLDDQLFAGLQNETADKFWEIVNGVATHTRPDWVTDGIAQSAVELVTALGRSASEAVLSGAGREVSFLSFSIDPVLWGMPGLDAPSEMTVAGRLYAVNTETRRFAIRDDVGNSIHLERVRNLDEASALVTQRVEAAGTGLRNKAGDLRLIDVVVVKVDLPAQWSTRVTTDIDDLLARAVLGPGPDPNGVDGISDDEMDEYFALISE